MSENNNCKCFVIVTTLRSNDELTISCHHQRYVDETVYGNEMQTVSRSLSLILSKK